MEDARKVLEAMVTLGIIEPERKERVMLELDSGYSGEPYRHSMTADQLIEKLQELDGGQHLEVRIIDDESEQVYENFVVRQGWLGPASTKVPNKVVLYIAINSWD